MGRVLLVVLWILFVPASDVTATSITTFPEAVQMYRAGQFDAAVAAVLALTQNDIDRSVRALLGLSPEPGRPRRPVATLDTLRPAAAVLAEATIALRIGRDQRWVIVMIAAERFIDRIDHLQPHSTFVRDWRLLLASALQGQHDLLVAMDFARGTWSWQRLQNIEQGQGVVAGTRAMEVLPSGLVGDEDAELRLAVACIHEMAWVRTAGKVEIHTTQGDLGVAVSELQQSIKLRPSVEARLHLGRVLTLAGKHDDAARVLGEIEPSIEPAFQYLLELFTGDLAERRGDMAGAAEHYGRAVAILPVAQSARVALAEVRHLAGDRSEAAAEMLDATAGHRDAPDTSDPWAWYVRGMAWHVEEYRARLRGAVHPEGAR